MKKTLKTIPPKKVKYKTGKVTSLAQRKAEAKAKYDTSIKTTKGKKVGPSVIKYKRKKS